MQIHGFNKTTLLDYPKHLAATIFLGGCNMRCPFCHNATLVTDPNSQPSISAAEVLSYLEKRRSILEGVCITGGEPTIYPELPDLIKQIKSLGFLVKLDTNGTNPSMLKYLVEEKLIDYVAMDIKNSPEKYALSSGVSDRFLKPISESVAYLLTEPVDYEFRTTIVKELHSEQDMISLGQWLQGAKAYFLQAFRDSDDIIMPGFSSHSKETLEHFVQILKPYITQVSLRGL
jgi:pyruvate formate lyase activating enzyme